MKILSLFLLSAATLAAQYRTESFDLQPGWSALYLNVDPGDVTLDTLLSGKPDITEVWHWRPADLDPDLQDGSQTQTGEWRVWKRGDVGNSTFFTFTANAAYLVNLKSTASPQTLRLKGEVVAPRVQWRTDGVNLVGFPVAAGTRPTLNRYLANAGLVDNNTQTYHYIGGPLGVSNPTQTPISGILAKRGQAFWIRSDEFTDFYGPVEVGIALDRGLDFGISGTLKRVVLRNRTSEGITVSLAPSASEAAPGSATPPVAPGLLVRSLNDSGTFDFAPLGAGLTVSIPANESRGIFFSVDRAAMTGNPGDLFAGLLKVTDGRGLSEIYLPVAAEKASLAGLWVGEVRISKVQNQLQRIQRDVDGNYLPDAPGNSSNTEINETAQEFKIRLLVHVDASGQAKLLSQAYLGIVGEDNDGGARLGLSTTAAPILAEHLKNAVRLSSANLPLGFNEDFDTPFRPGANLKLAIALGANHPTNPFLHRYHPDHDNKDARFENALPAGIESHHVVRNVTLAIAVDGGLSGGPAWGTSRLSGIWTEDISGIHKNPIVTSGDFTLSKVSDLATLILP